MQQVFTGGRVFTSDPQTPWAEAVVTDDARIVFVGSADDAVAHAGTDAVHVDVAGGVVMPGFVDAHSHLEMTGDALLKAPLRTATSIVEIQQRLRVWADANPNAPRVLGLGWTYTALPGGVPHRELLDAVVGDRPAYLEASDLHSSWVNTLALRELGITDETPDPIGGRIVRDPVTGEATGHLLENASVTMVWPMLARVDRPTRDGYLATAMRAYNESGVTSAVDMALGGATLESMQRFDEAGDLTVRVIAHWLIHRTGDATTELAQVREVQRIVAAGSTDHLRVAGIKIIVDGTIDGCTAAMINPYTTGTNDDGIWDPESLQRVVIAADAAGLQVALHAIGDMAVRNAIDALEAAAVANGPGRAPRHRIEHLEYVDPADVGRLAALGITASMQPVHCDPAYLSNWIAMLGEQRANRGFAWREFLDAGTTLAFGTDTPTAPHFPLHNMYIAATRRSPGDPSAVPLRADNSLPLEQAVIHGTRDAAWASFAEGSVGMLRAGMAADLIVVDTDPFGADPSSLLQARVMLTMVSGRIVHDAR